MYDDMLYVWNVQSVKRVADAAADDDDDEGGERGMRKRRCEQQQQQQQGSREKVSSYREGEFFSEKCC